jgi:hypothetical protein
VRTQESTYTLVPGKRQPRPASVLVGSTSQQELSHRVRSYQVLCTRCRSLFQGKLLASTKSEGYSRIGSHHLTTVSFRDSVKQGCRTCVDIWGRIAHISWRETLSAPFHSTGFTSYGITYYPENEAQGSVYFHLNAKLDDMLQFDRSTTILHIKLDSMVSNISLFK